MREASLLKASLKPTWTSFMIQTRHELGSYTPLVKIVVFLNAHPQMASLIELRAMESSATIREIRKG
jgi:hypothetical protein